MKYSKQTKVVLLLTLTLLTGNLLAQRQPSIQYWRPYDQLA